MKRQMIVIVLIVCLMNLSFIGCGTQQAPTGNSVSENASVEDVTLNDSRDGTSANQSLSFYLPDSTYIEATKTILNTDVLEFTYTATYPDNSSVTRSVQIEESLKSIYVRDAAGEMVVGYALDIPSESEINLSLYDGDNSIAIETGKDDSTPVRLAVVNDGNTQEVSFTDYDEFDQAVELYANVQAGNISTEDLSGDEINLFSRVEDFLNWAADVQSDEGEREIGTVVELTSAPELDEWLGDMGFDDESSIQDIPSWLKFACKVVDVLDRICKIAFDGSLFCEWVSIGKIVCDFIGENFS